MMLQPVHTAGNMRRATRRMRTTSWAARVGHQWKHLEPRGANVGRPGKRGQRDSRYLRPRPLRQQMRSPQACWPQRPGVTLRKSPTNNCRRAPSKGLRTTTWAGSSSGIATSRGSATQGPQCGHIGLRAPAQNTSHDQASRSCRACQQGTHCSRCDQRGGSAPPRRRRDV